MKYITAAPRKAQPWNIRTMHIDNGHNQPLCGNSLQEMRPVTESAGPLVMCSICKNHEAK
jgi:hypothetical protein